MMERELYYDINKHGIVDFDGVCSTDILAFNTKGTSINRYVDFYLHLPNFIEAMVANSKGINLPRVSEKIVLNYPVPLAPFSEQQRLVGIISSLFADLDEAKEKLTAVVEGFAQRKAAILHQAFTGELTVKWREKNGNSLDDWNEVAFDDCVDKMQNGLSKRNGYEGKDYAVLRLANIGSDDIVTDDLRYIMLNDKEQEKYELYNGDVLMIRVNGSKDNVARQIYVSNPKNWAFCDHLIRINYKDNINSRYMVTVQSSCNKIKYKTVYSSPESISAPHVG